MALNEPAPTLMDQIRQKAQQRLEANLYGTAAAAKEALDKLGEQLAQGLDTVVLKAPLKGKERATEKVKTDYGGDWLDLKDVVRLTLVPEDEIKLYQVVERIRKTCQASNGYGMVKDVVTDPNTDPCGYSGNNFVIRFGSNIQQTTRNATGVFVPMRQTLQDESRIVPISSMERASYAGYTGEIQVNTIGMMFGKMRKAKFVEFFGQQAYMSWQARSGVEGGAGHALYEIWRAAGSTQNQKDAAADLSRRYYRRIRGFDFRPAQGEDLLKQEVAPYCKEGEGH